MNALTLPSLSKMLLYFIARLISDLMRILTDGKKPMIEYAKVAKELNMLN